MVFIRPDIPGWQVRPLNGPGLTPTMCASPVVFDLDGVIVETHLVKYRAMLSLFGDQTDQQDAIARYILANGGVSRRIKLAYLLKNHVCTEPTEALLSDYLQRYAARLAHELATAPMVPGVEPFIARYPAARYVCSSAPEAEVHDQITRRSLARHFAAVYGSDTPKSTALRAIAATHPGQPIVFFGDSVGDWEAARQAGVAFVGVTRERDNFQGLPVLKLQDFTSPEIVQATILQAIAQGEA